MQEYDKWNEIKKETQKDKKIRLYKERDIFFIKMGQNIAIIPQLKMYSTQRLLNKIGVMNKVNFDELKKEIKRFLD